MRKGLFLAIAAVGAALAFAAPASAGSICLPVAATGVGHDHGGGMTTAEIRTFGILLGTTSAQFTLQPPQGAVLPFTGPIKFTTAIGTLTAQVAGTLDPSTGDFRADSTSLAGTGLFRGVTGNLRFVGTEDLVSGDFTERITGRLCAGFPH